MAPFTSDSGTSIQFGPLLSAVMGAIVATWSGVTASVFGRVVDAWIVSPLTGIGSFLNNFATQWYTGLANTISAGSVDPLRALGPFAFVGGLAVVVVGSYLFFRVVRAA
jgi:hypothetical protein